MDRRHCSSSILNLTIIWRKSRGPRVSSSRDGKRSRHERHKKCTYIQHTHTTTMTTTTNTAQECLEDYVEFAANLMLPSPGDGAPSYHSLPTMSALSFLTHPKRRRTVWEDWSPYAVSLFEAGIAHHGKDFHAIRKEFAGRKSTQQIIDFYYVWKKTSHYKKWKKTYIPPYLDVSEDEDDDEDDDQGTKLSGKEGSASASNNHSGKPGSSSNGKSNK